MKLTIVWSPLGILPEAARQIRTSVFVEEQGFVEEFDVVDGQSWHVLLLMDGTPCGVARMFWEDRPTVMRLGRFALSRGARGAGHGRVLIDACCDQAQAFGAVRIVLDAQKRAKGFYEACGFVAVGDEFMEEDYPHYRMECDLTERG